MIALGRFSNSADLLSYWLKLEKTFTFCRADESYGEDMTPKEDGFDYTVDLVKFIKSEFGDHFTIGVVGM